MVEPIRRTRPDDDSGEIADVSHLFSLPAGNQPPPPPPDLARPFEPDEYALDGPEPEVDRTPSPPIPPVPPRAPRPSREESPTSTSKPSRVERETFEDDESDRPTRSRAAAPASSGVEEVWSRGAEWGGSLVVLGIGAIAAGVLLYATFKLDALGLWVVLAAGCLAGLVVLAYPIFITFDRPVRVAPEHAARDFFDAFSHLVPHTRRMWLLLGEDGRRSRSYASYSAFRGHWKGLLAGWKTKAGVSSPFNPFEIEVTDFRSEKSAGASEVEATFTARVVKRSTEGDRVVASYPVEARIVRGPDKMWYLDSPPLGRD